MKKFHFLLAILAIASVFTACKDKTTTDDTPTSQEMYDAASAINGGKLYSKFWAEETGWTAPSDINLADITDYSNFYRCKQCHGWDLKGRSGAYIGRAPKTSRPNVAAGVDLMEVRANDDIDKIFDAVKHTNGRSVDPTKTADGTNTSLGGDAMPNYGALLTDAQIWDLVKFIKEGAFDVTQLYDFTLSGTYPTGSIAYSNIGKDGDAAAGDTYFASKCASCHGSAGNNGSVTIVDDGDTLSVGYFGRHKPYEMQHKIKFGHLGSSMTGDPNITVADAKNLFKALQDTTKYPD